MNDDLQMAEMITVMVCFKALFQQLPGETAENKETCQGRDSNPGPHENEAGIVTNETRRSISSRFLVSLKISVTLCTKHIK